LATRRLSIGAGPGPLLRLPRRGDDALFGTARERACPDSGRGRARRTPEPRAASRATHKHRQIALVPAAAGPSQTNTSVVHTPDQVRNQPASSAHGVSAAVHALNTRARARASNASNNVDKSCKTGHHATGGDDDAKHGTIGATARPDLTSLVPDPAAILRSGPDATQPATRPWRRQR